jgi:hypothetical protein
MAGKSPRTRSNSRGTPPGEGTVKPAHGGTIGNPPFVPNDEQRAFVRENACLKGALWTALQIGISRSALYVHFKEEIAAAKADACAEIGMSLFAKAKSGDGASQRFFLVTQGGGDWSPKVKHEHSGLDGGPIQTVNVDLTEFLAGKTEAELAIAENLLTQLLGAATGGDGIASGDLGFDPQDPGT